MAISQPYLIDGIPAGKVERGTSEFAIFERYASGAKEAGWVSKAGASAISRWFKRGHTRTLNRQLAQYGWKLDDFGQLVERSVKFWLEDIPEQEPEENTHAADHPTEGPFESGRIQVRSGYVVDTYTNQKCNPKDMYRLKNIYG